MPLLPSPFLGAAYLRRLKPWVLAVAAVLWCWLMASPVQAFCGFFVATANGSLENTASQVVIVHSGDRSIFMMANDFQGDVKDFARIVPIPVIPSREQVSIGDGALIEKLSGFTAPRLTQYFDRPCRQEHKWYRIFGLLAIPFAAFFLITWLRPEANKLAVLLVLLVMAILVVVALPSFLNQAHKAGSSATVLPSASAITIEDQFSVGEYDVAILSANESNELITWLQQNQYQVGADAADMLQSYIDRGMKFFVVRVNLEEFQKRKGQFLRPIVLDYESDEFMLPIRLGTLNAKDDQDLIIHVLSPQAYVETTNYETLAVPTDVESRSRWPSGEELPAFIQDDFGEFYNSVFEQTYRDHPNSVFLEYATRSFGGNIKCDPCTVAADQMPTMDDFKAMGAWWGEESPETLITRLHVRYNATTFPEDLQFREIFPEELAEKEGIVDRSFPQWAGVDFQARYVIRRPMGAAVCGSRWRYRQGMSRAAKNLALLTGWDIQEIRQKMATERRLNALDADGHTQLQRAVMAADVAQATSLVEQGANVNLMGNQRWGMTPLVGAIATNQPELVQLLLDNGADVNVSWRGEPLLLWTIGYSDLTTVKQLLEAGVSSSSLDLVWETAQLSGNAELIETLRPYVEGGQNL